jgi:hypothetical protein
MLYGWDGERSGGSGLSRASESDDSSFKSAREAYREDPKPSKESPRSKPDDSEKSARSKGESRKSEYKSRVGTTPPPIGKNISTESTHPFVGIVDVTGSMSEWPKIIFEKLPLLGEEIKRYTPDYAISFCACGDARCDNFPLQVRDFGKDSELDEHVLYLYPEGKGGDAPESYGLPAYYYIYHCQMPKAVKPILVFILDDAPHRYVTKIEIKKYTGDDVQEDLLTSDLFKMLMEKFIVYVVLKGCGEKSYWDSLLGKQRVVVMSEPRDVVEILIGIYAGEMGEFGDFEMRSSARHADKPERISRVKSSLRSVKEKSAEVAAKKEDSGKSKISGSKKAGSPSLRSKKLDE